MSKRYISLFLTVVLCGTLWISATALEQTPDENCPPVAENISIETLRGVPVEGQLIAVDPEDDDITFVITTPPGKGIIDLNEDGSFKYTPAAGKRGRDYFGFRAIDSCGNKSQEATAIIKLLKPQSCD